MIYVEYVLLMLFGYFVGNISWARIISKAKHDDITKHGSGNPGSTNMLRTYGAKIGFLTLFLDVVKGAIPALAGLLLFKYTGLNQDIGLYVGGLSVILGHMFPVIYNYTYKYCFVNRNPHIFNKFLMSGLPAACCFYTGNAPPFPEGLCLLFRFVIWRTRCNGSHGSR